MSCPIKKRIARRGIPTSGFPRREIKTPSIPRRFPRGKTRNGLPIPLLHKGLHAISLPGSEQLTRRINRCPQDKNNVCFLCKFYVWPRGSQILGQMCHQIKHLFLRERGDKTSSPTSIIDRNSYFHESYRIFARESRSVSRSAIHQFPGFRGHHAVKTLPGIPLYLRNALRPAPSFQFPRTDLATRFLFPNPSHPVTVRTGQK